MSSPLEHPGQLRDDLEAPGQVAGDFYAACLDEAGVEWHERDHGIATGLFFRDPDGRLLEAITYASGDDPRRP